MQNKLFKCLISAAVILVIMPVRTQQNRSKPEKPENIRCALSLRNYHPAGLYYSTGYCYEMMRKYAESVSCGIDIGSAESTAGALGYILTDSIDLAVVPCDSTITASGLYICSDILEDSTLLVINKGKKELAESIFAWARLYKEKKEFTDLKKRFTPNYEPYRRADLGGEYASASPYDKIIREYAAKIGWDWRMLTALIWQESRFCIDARSGKGAEGLLQMLPTTALRFNNDDMLDPEKNVSAGTQYLKKLSDIFSPLVDDEDLTKFVLAAYSAGEGRVLDCIRYARAHNLPYSKWSDLKNIISILMEDGQAASDSLLQYGGLRGYDTINYVSYVYSLYDAFMIISP